MAKVTSGLSTRVQDSQRGRDLLNEGPWGHTGVKTDTGSPGVGPKEVGPRRNPGGVRCLLFLPWGRGQRE